MSIKIYNEETKKWEVQASAVATNIMVADAAGNFSSENKTVENCLSEMKDDVKLLNQKVHYIYQNGGANPGNGGGGKQGAELTIEGFDFSTSKKNIVNVNSEQVLEFYYSFESTNRGNGKLTLTCDGLDYKESFSNLVQNERYKVNIGPFIKKQEYVLHFKVEDSQGMSDAKIIYVHSGSLQIKNNLDPDQQFVPGEFVEIPYELDMAIDQNVTVERIFNVGSNQTVNKISQKKGSYIWSLTLPQDKGIYPCKMVAYNSDKSVVSDEIMFYLIAADSKTLQMVSSFPKAPAVNKIKRGEFLNIDFTNSMQYQDHYRTFVYIDDMENPVDELYPTYNKRNWWSVGESLSLGTHRLKIETFTLDNQHSAELEFIFQVEDADFSALTHIEDGLIAYFDASSKSNSSNTKHIWQNIAPESSRNNNITCDLFDFNYEVNGEGNGWVVVDRDPSLPQTGALHGVNVEKRQETVLRLSGKSHAVINHKLFGNGLNAGRGLTFEITYKAENTGDINAKILSCKSGHESEHGLTIGVEKAIAKAAGGEQADANFNEKQWITATYVISRTEQKMKIYLNGIVTGTAHLPTITGANDNLKHDKPIILGAEILNSLRNPIERDPDFPVIEEEDPTHGGLLDENEYLTNFANADIRSVRIYNRPLNSSEVVTNYLSDMKYEAEQIYARKLNEPRGEDTFSVQIPEVTIISQADIDGVTWSNCKVTYNDHVSTPVDLTGQIQWQGTSSTDYDVKNYTLVLKENDRDYFGWAPKDTWMPEARWTLKADYVDSSHANNIGSARYIEDFFRAVNYAKYPCHQNDTTGGKIRSTVDGVPVRLYIGKTNSDKKSAGIYTFNIDRYSYHNYGFATYDVNGAMTKNPNIVSYEIASNDNSWEGDYSDAALTKTWNEKARLFFKHRYNGATDNPTENIYLSNVSTEVLSGPKQHLDLVALLKWVSSANKQTFIDEMKYHFSVEHMIDYLLIAHVLGMVDSLGKNMVITSYGTKYDTETEDVLWYPSFYDMDTILGLDNTGNQIHGPGITMDDYATSDAKIWKFMLEDDNMRQRIENRYKELRDDVVLGGGNYAKNFFTVEKIMSYYGGQIVDTIGQDLYNEDIEVKYYNQSNSQYKVPKGNRRSFIEKWLTERFIFLDSYFNYTNYQQDRLTMRSRATGDDLKIYIKTYSPQMTRVEFANGSLSVTKKTDKYGWTEFRPLRDIEIDANNNITIFGASNILDICGDPDSENKSLKGLKLENLVVSKAERLVGLDISGSDLITELSLDKNIYLRRLNIKDCKKLGNINEGGDESNIKVINLANCKNLRNVNCSNSGIRGISFPVGGVIENISLDNTDIVDFTLIGQEYIRSLPLANCKKLTSVQIENCSGLKTANVSSATSMAVFVASNCQKLESIDVSQNASLTTFKLSLCPELKTLNMANVSNKAISTLDLRTTMKLEDLNISSSSTIRHLVFGVGYNALKNLNCANSAIESIRYDITATPPDYIDLNGFNLNKISFEACQKVKQILNVNLNTSSPYRAFYNCTSLQKVTGTLKFSGAMTQTFYNCKSLTSLPLSTMTLAGVTSMSETFTSCSKITLNDMVSIMSKVNGSLTSMYNTFAYCAGIKGELPSNFFERAVNLANCTYVFRSTPIEGQLPDTLLHPMAERLKELTYSFDGTKISGAITDKLFEKSTGLTTVHRTFNNCTGLTVAPTNNVFKNCTALTNVYGTFAGCSNMEGEVPMRVLANKSNMISVGAMFNGCSKLTGTLTDEILDCNNGKNNSIDNAEYMLAGTKIDGNIPSTLFKKCINIANIAGFLSNCSKITGAIPANLLSSNKSLVKVDHLFNGCSGLGSDGVECTIPANLLANNTNINNVKGLFAGCKNITGSIPRNLLHNNPLVTDVAQLFKNCIKLGGEIPARVSREVTKTDPETGETYKETEIVEYGLFDKCNKIIDISELFYGCDYLKGSIPPEIFERCSGVKTANHIFYGCRRITGDIPENLFKGFTALEEAKYTFAQCYNLGPTRYDSDPDVEGYKYAIPENLFKDCQSLWTIEGFMCWDYTNRLNPLNMKGELPPKLFANCINLKNMKHAFDCTSNIQGPLDGGLFSKCTLLENMEHSFVGTAITSFGTGLFDKNTKLKNMTDTFRSCSSLKGDAFNYKKLSHVTSYVGCMTGCTGLNNYNDIVNDGWA